MNTHTLRAGIDIGSARHRVAVGLPDGKLIDELDIDHHAAGFKLFFARMSCMKHVTRCSSWSPWKATTAGHGYSTARFAATAGRSTTSTISNSPVRAATSQAFGLLKPHAPYRHRPHQHRRHRRHLNQCAPLSQSWHGEI